MFLRSSGYDPDGHNCYLSAVEVNTLTNLDLVFDDNWSVYESYLADYCPQNVQPFPSGGGGGDGEYDFHGTTLLGSALSDIFFPLCKLSNRRDNCRSLPLERADWLQDVVLRNNRKKICRFLD